MNLRASFLLPIHLAFAWGMTTAAAQTPPPTTSEVPAVVRLNDDEYEVGLVRLNKRLRTLTFPAQIEIRDGDLEYAVVHVTGKTHETLLATEVEPQQIHVAALLMDAVGQSPSVTVSWSVDEGKVDKDLANLIQIISVPTDLLTSDIWIYNGSKFQDGTFAAQTEGSIIALMPDPLALVNHKASMKLDRDDVFKSKTSALPKNGTPVTVCLRFGND